MKDNKQQSTIVGVFDDYNTAQTASRELIEAGIPREDVRVQSNVATGTAGSSIDSYEDRPRESQETGVRGFFQRIFGEHHAHREHYEEALRRGSSIVVVTAPENMVDRTTDILNRNGAIDIDHRVEAYREAGWTGYDPNAPAYTSDEARRERERFGRAGETQTIPVVQEELEVGKRVIRRGGVRVYTEVEEVPVEENVSLRNEHVSVERRPVNREVTPAEADQVHNQSIEVTENSEEPVVSKRARVVEEVVVGKDVTNRTEKVTDKVRRTKVNVEKLGDKGEDPNKNPDR